MATKKSSPPLKTTETHAARSRPVYHRVHALLQSVREIAQFEDLLCELTHELKHSETLSGASRKELAELLDRIPSHVFQSSLEGARAALTGKKAKRVTASAAKKSAAKKSGRAPSR